MKKFYLALFLICFSGTLFSQNQHKSDSLKRLYSSQEKLLSDSIKFEILREIVLFEGHKDQALIHGQLLLKIARASNEQIKVAEAFEELSLVHRSLGNVIKSTEVALKAQTIYKELGLSHREAASHAQLASNLILEQQYQESINEYHEALHVYQQEKDIQVICLTLLNIGEVFRLMPQLDSALFYTQESLRLNSSNDQIVHGYATGNLGLIYQQLGLYSKARPLLLEAIELLKDLGDLYSVSVYNFELGNVMIQQGNHGPGEENMLKAYQLALNENFKEQIRDFSKSLVGYYESNGSFQKALHFQQQYQLYKDSLINIDNVRQVEQLKSQYEVNQREVEITLLSQISHSQQQQVLALSIGTTLLILLLGLLYRNNQQKKKANVALTLREKEKALLLQELNHRTKNNLQMISSLLNLQSLSLEGNPAAAAVRDGRYRVDSLALIHQKLYTEDFSHLNMKQYLQELIDHLSVSFNPEFKIETNIVACQMNVDQAIPLALIINELLTNAFKYGWDQSKSEHYVGVVLKKDKDQLCLSIQDNGPGMEKPDVNALPSFGLGLVYSLVDQLEGDIEFDGTAGTNWNINFAYD